MRGSARSEKAWPYVRAGLVAFHLLSMCTLSLPRVSESALTPASRSTRTGQAAFEGWSDRLGVDKGELESSVVEVARDWNGLRDVLTTPFEAYAELVGAEQRWQVFVGSDRFPARFEVEIEVDGQWRRVQSMYPTDSDWYADALGHPRARSTVFASSWPPYQRRRRRLAHGLAVRIAAEFPEATHMRLVMRRIATPSAEQVRAGIQPPGEEARRDLFDLEVLR